MKIGGTLSDMDLLEAEWLVHRFNETTGGFRFVKYSRAERSGVPFLTDDHLPSRDWTEIPGDKARAIAQRAPLHYIFHSGFCCSTLLAACLDLPGLASSFSEPMVLNDVVGWRLRGAPPPAVGEALQDALHLLARPFAGDQAAVVKPSSVANGLANAMLALQPQSRAIVMHAPLSDFLLSIAKKGLDGRRWVREMFVKMRAEGRVQLLGFDDIAFLGQTDLQIAAMAWLAQQQLFAHLIAELKGRVRSLDSASFMASPQQAIAAAADHFGLILSAAQWAAIEEGPLRHDSKSGKQFTSADRKAEYDRMMDLYGDEVSKVVAWTAQVADSQNLPMSLSLPVVPSV